MAVDWRRGKKVKEPPGGADKAYLVAFATGYRVAAVAAHEMTQFQEMSRWGIGSSPHDGGLEAGKRPGKKYWDSPGGGGELYQNAFAFRYRVAALAAARRRTKSGPRRPEIRNSFSPPGGRGS